jgi:CdvA-like coiled-coil domain
VHKLISWKHSFRRLSEEFDVARKKKQALDNLLNNGKISQSTHDIFNKEIDEAIADIEKQQKALLEKMASKVVELEGQVKSLEILLANYEIRHVTGEIDEESYQRDSELLGIGLETAKQELEQVKDAADHLAVGEFPLDEDAEPQTTTSEADQTEVKFFTETPPAEEKENDQAVVEAVAVAEASPTDTETKVEEKQEN